ncbi:MAG: transglutaminase family protein [Acidobacteriota bacterium]|nr:transglutaminase family protein [Acidobacteriota bacterium]
MDPVTQRPLDAEEFAPYLAAGATVQSEDPWVVALTDRVASGEADPTARAVALYYAVRDDIRYDPYSSELTVAGLSARRTLELGRGWCVSKAILLAACCRASAVPARLGFADVRNHLSTEKMRERMQTDVFYWHGYTSIYLEGQWVKATPAFNVELCEKLGLGTLEFDGREDSIYHPFDLEGNRHMEYLKCRGEFAEPPVDAIVATFRDEYSHWREDHLGGGSGDFEREIIAETRLS